MTFQTEMHKVCYYLNQIIGAVLLLPKSYVDVPAGPRKSDFLYTFFCIIFHPTVFYVSIICPKYTQYVI